MSDHQFFFLIDFSHFNIIEFPLWNQSFEFGKQTPMVAHKSLGTISVIQIVQEHLYY